MLRELSRRSNMSSMVAFLLLSQLLLIDPGFCRAPPRAPGNTHPVEEQVSPDRTQDLENSAQHFVAVLREKLHGLHVEEGHGFDGGCEELLDASGMDDSLSSALPRELLGLSLVPALVMGGCTDEARTLVLKLYELLGVMDTQELLLDLEEVMHRRRRRPRPSVTDMEAVMVNIQLLAEVTPVKTKKDREARGRRLRRSVCVNRKEERVYKVMEWIPGVSTFYNLGSAVYYASVNCTDAAQERAILSAVDLGTDAIVVATGGTAGLAGYAMGAGVKTGVKAGVKYLVNRMKHHDDVLVNQHSPEEGVFTVP